MPPKNFQSTLPPSGEARRSLTIRAVPLPTSGNKPGASVAPPQPKFLGNPSDARNGGDTSSKVIRPNLGKPTVLGLTKVRRGVTYICVQGKKRLVWNVLGEAQRKNRAPTDKWAVVTARKAAKSVELKKEADTKVSNRFAALADDEEDDCQARSTLDPLVDDSQQRSAFFVQTFQGLTVPEYNVHRNWWFHSDKLSQACCDRRIPKRKRALYRRWWMYRAKQPYSEQWRVERYLFGTKVPVVHPDVNKGSRASPNTEHAGAKHAQASLSLKAQAGTERDLGTISPLEDMAQQMADQSAVSIDEARASLISQLPPTDGEKAFSWQTRITNLVRPKSNLFEDPESPISRSLDVPSDAIDIDSLDLDELSFESLPDLVTRLKSFLPDESAKYVRFLIKLHATFNVLSSVTGPLDFASKLYLCCDAIYEGNTAGVVSQIVDSVTKRLKAQAAEDDNTYAKISAWCGAAWSGWAEKINCPMVDATVDVLSALVYLGILKENYINVFQSYGYRDYANRIKQTFSSGYDVLDALIKFICGAFDCVAHYMDEGVIDFTGWLSGERKNLHITYSHLVAEATDARIGLFGRKENTHFQSAVHYRKALDSTIDILTKLVSRKRGIEQITYNRMLEKLLVIKDDHTTHAFSMTCRVKPFTVSIFGPTSSMKSAVCGAVWKSIAIANGIDYSPENVCTVNFKDQYFSEVTNQQVLILDDFMNERPETLKGGQVNPIRILLDWSSQNPVQLPAAAVEEKGKRTCSAQILCLTHHEKTFKAEALSSQPEAAYRRVELYIEVEMRNEYRDDLGQPDFRKIPSAGFPDVWLFNVWKYKIRGHEGEFVKVRENLCNYELLEFVNAESKLHFDFQRENVKLRNDVSTFFCEHGSVKGACRTCDTAIHVDPVDTAVYDLWGECMNQKLTAEAREKDMPTVVGTTATFSGPHAEREPTRPATFVDKFWIDRYRKLLECKGNMRKASFAFYDWLFFFKFGIDAFLLIARCVATAMTFGVLSAAVKDYLEADGPLGILTVANRHYNVVAGHIRFVSRLIRSAYPGDVIEEKVQNLSMRYPWIRNGVIRFYRRLPTRMTRWAVAHVLDSGEFVTNKSLWELATFGYGDHVKMAANAAAFYALFRLLSFVHALYKRGKCLPSPSVGEVEFVQKHVEEVVNVEQHATSDKHFQVDVEWKKPVLESEAAEEKYVDKLVNEKKSMWYQVSLPTTVIPGAAATSAVGVLEAKLRRCLKFAELTYVREENGEKRKKAVSVHILFVKGQDFLIPTHTLHSDATDFVITTVVPNDSELSDHVMGRFNRGSVYDLPNSDFSLVRLRSTIPRPDITEFFAVEHSRPLGRFFMVENGVCVSKGDRNLGLRSVQDINIDGSVYKSLPLHVTTPYPVSTFSGLCGAVWLANPHGRTFIHSLHIAGDGFTGASLPILRSELLHGLSELDARGVLSAHSASRDVISDKFTVSPLVPERHFVRFLEKDETPGTLLVIGAHDRPNVTVRQNIHPSPIAEGMRLELGWEPAHGKVPHPNSVKHFQNAMAEIIKPRCMLHPGVLDLACEDYSAHIFKQLEAKYGDLAIHVHPLPDSVVVSGQDGIVGVDHMNPSTSAGFPERGPKSRFFVTTEEGCDFITSPLTLDDEHLAEVARVEEVLASGERANLPITMSVKVEPTKLTKEYARIFGCSNITLTFLFRRYFLSIFRLIYLDPLVFEMAIGMNVHGTDWDRLAAYLKHHDRIVAGDYKTYDKVMSADLILRAFDILIRIAERAGYTSRQLQIMRGIATEIAFPLYEGKGVLFVAAGSNPSGHPGTTVINCIVNSLYMRYCFFMQAPKIDVTFSDFVNLATMGDDHIAGVDEMCTWFDCPTIQRVLGDADIVYTNAQKTATFDAPFERLVETTFVSRGFRFCDFMNRWVAPLAEKSLKKSYLVQSIDKRCPYDPPTLSYIVAEQNDVELFFHGRDYYDRVANGVRRAFEHANIPAPPLKPWESFKSKLDGEELPFVLEAQAFSIDTGEMTDEEQDRCDVIAYTMRDCSTYFSVVNQALKVVYTIDAFELAWHLFDFTFDRLRNGVPIFRSGHDHTVAVHPRVFYGIVEMLCAALSGSSLKEEHGAVCLEAPTTWDDSRSGAILLSIGTEHKEWVPRSLHVLLCIFFGQDSTLVPHRRHTRWIGEGVSGDKAKSHWRNVVTVTPLKTNHRGIKRSYASTDLSVIGTTSCATNHALEDQNRFTTRSTNDSGMGAEATVLHNQTSLSNWTSVRATGTDSSHTVIMPGKETIETFLSRPVLIEAVDWGIGVNFYKSYTPLTNVLTFMAPKLERFAFATFKLVIDFEVTGNPFLYGMLMANWIPYPKYDFLLRDRALVPEDNVEASQRQRLFIDASTSAGGRMEIPFYWPNDAFHLIWDDPADFGTLSIRTLNNLSHVTGGNQTVSITIRAHLEDLQVYGNTTVKGPSRTLVVQSSEMPQGSFSTAATRVADVAKMLSPVVGPYAIATEKAARAAAAGLRAAGLSHPRNLEPTSRFENVPLGNKSNFNESTNAISLGLDRMNEVSPSPYHTGLGEDEMSFDYILKKETYVRTLTWDIGSTPGTSLANIRVSPTIFTKTQREIHATPMLYLSRLFRFWTGPIKFRFQVVCSAFHRGKLRFVHDPVVASTNTQAAETWTVLNNVILDISQEREVTIEVPYIQVRQWAKVLGVSAGDAFLSVDTPSIPKLEETCGSLVVSVMNRLVTPDPTVTAPAYINVYVSAGDNFKFASPAETRYIPIYPALSTTTTDVVAGRTLDVVGGFVSTGGGSFIRNGVAFTALAYSPVAQDVSLAFSLTSRPTATPAAPLTLKVGSVTATYPFTPALNTIEAALVVPAQAGWNTISIVPTFGTDIPIPTFAQARLPVPPGTTWKSAVTSTGFAFDESSDTKGSDVASWPTSRLLYNNTGSSVRWVVGGKTGLYSGGANKYPVVVITEGDLNATRDGIVGVTQGVYGPYSEFWGPQITKKTIIPTGPGTFQNTTFSINLKSGGSALVHNAIFLTAQSGQVMDMGAVESDPSPASGMPIHDEAPQTQTSAIYHGESIMHVRQVIGRPAFYRVYATTDSSATGEGVRAVVLGDSDIPNPPGAGDYDAKPKSVLTPLNYLMACYNGWRGSIRSDYILAGELDSALMLRADRQAAETVDVGNRITAWNNSTDPGFGGLYTSGWAGSSITNPRLSNHLHVEFPYYYRYRFSSARPKSFQTSSRASGTHAIASVHSDAFKATRFAMLRYIQPGEDFSLVNWMGTPILYDEV